MTTFGRLGIALFFIEKLKGILLIILRLLVIVAGFSKIFFFVCSIHRIVGFYYEFFLFNGKAFAFSFILAKR